LSVSSGLWFVIFLILMSANLCDRLRLAVFHEPSLITE